MSLHLNHGKDIHRRLEQVGNPELLRQSKGIQAAPTRATELVEAALALIRPAQCWYANI